MGRCQTSPELSDVKFNRQDFMWKDWTLEFGYLNQSIGILLVWWASAHKKVFKSLSSHPKVLNFSMHLLFASKVSAFSLSSFSVLSTRISIPVLMLLIYPVWLFLPFFLHFSNSYSSFRLCSKYCFSMHVLVSQRMYLHFSRATVSRSLSVLASLNIGGPPNHLCILCSL